VIAACTGTRQCFAVPATTTDRFFPLRRKKTMKPEVKAKQTRSGDRKRGPSATPAVLQIGPDGIITPFVTHWSRIFYYDLFSAEAGLEPANATEKHAEALPRPAEPFAVPDGRRKEVETSMARKDSDQDDWLPRFRTPIEAAVILLGLYIAIYLAIGGIVHVLGSPDAAAAAARNAAIAKHAAAPSAAVESPRREPLDDESERSMDSEATSHDHVD
jgi:hypothetical protein